MARNKRPNLSKKQVEAMINAVSASGRPRQIKRRGLKLGDAYNKAFKR
jgi:hypothetical protein